ncbi:Uncharacterised protein [Mycolicibacterium chitae]|uniref:Uncharacterized protein n=1 Tax=Mycolicibacterium chitae TaxID=1792 RepID=A0A448HZI7_MYCCI|nr:Uncharacterised protein [Mycolicibacterium chitae]
MAPATQAMTATHNATLAKKCSKWSIRNGLLGSTGVNGSGIMLIPGPWS